MRFRDWSLIMGRGRGATKREWGACEGQRDSRSCLHIYCISNTISKMKVFLDQYSKFKLLKYMMSFVDLLSFSDGMFLTSERIHIIMNIYAFLDLRWSLTEALIKRECKIIIWTILIS